MRAEEIQGLMETYSKVYETPEVLSEGVIEEETQQLNEYGAGGTGGTAQDLINKRQATLKKVGGTLGAGGGQAAMAALQKKGVDPRSAYDQVYRQGETNLDAKPAAKPAPKPAAKPGTPVAAKPTTPSAPARPTSPAKPAAAPAAAPNPQLLLPNQQLLQHLQNQQDLQWISGQKQIQNSLLQRQKEIAQEEPVQPPILS